MNRVVEVLPEVTGIDRAFAYEVPPELAGAIALGCVVRVVLNGRRVRGWVVAESGPQAGIELRPVSEIVSLGPPPQVVELARWASWRYAGRLRPLLVSASAPRQVRELPPPAPVRHGAPASRPAPGEDEIASATAQALSVASSVLRLPPAAPRLAVVQAAIADSATKRGDLLVLAASRGDAVTLARRLERSGRPVALQPEAWAQAAAGGRTVIGTRSAVLAPLETLSALVVLDAHADSYQEERVPTWEAAVLARERARRAGVPCVLVSACPPVDMLAGGHLVTLSRESERAGWAPLELLDARDEDPRTGGYPERLSAVIRAAVAAQPGRPVVAVLNRKGRARLLACGRCRAVLRCETCGAALIQLERPAAGEPALLSCQRCASSSPALCAACGPTRPRALRPGAARARDDLAALTGLEVTEVAGTEAQGPEQAAVLVGTEAVLHRASGASLVVFLDFDQELVAPRYRAGEQALALLALASRLVGGRRRDGRVVVRTRLCEHEALQAALHADPGRLADIERQRRVLLRLPPTTELALVSGEGAGELVSHLDTARYRLEVGSLSPGRFLVRAPGPDLLAEALAAAGHPAARARVEVAPRQV